MINYEINVEQYKEMIRQPEFTMKQYAYVGYDEFEKLVSYGDLANLFEELAGRYGRVPTQNEYVKEGLTRCKAFFIGKAKPNGDRWLSIGKHPNGKPIWHNFIWEDRLERAVVQRLARSYPSHMVEYSTILTLKTKFPEFKVGANDYLDGIMAVDIVVGSPKHDKLLYVHVTSESSYSDYWLKKKESRDGIGFDKAGNKHYYKRNFMKGHVHLAFSKCDSESTEVINGIPVIKLNHIQEVLEKAFTLAPTMDTWKEKEQLCKLHDWLKENNIDKNGLGSVWL